MFSRFNTCWHYDDKIRQYYLLKSLGFPIIESYIFWEKEHALEWAEKAAYPVVFKLKKGASSDNVILIKNQIEAKKIILRCLKGMPTTGIKHKGKVKYKNLEDYLRHKD